MRVLLAPDSFKGSIGAADGGRRAGPAGWRAARPGDEVACLPLADGGEGTLDMLAAAVPGRALAPGHGHRPGRDAGRQRLAGAARAKARWSSWPGPAGCRC